MHLKQILTMIFRPLRFENGSVSFVITLSPENLKHLKSVSERKKKKWQKADNQSMESNHSVNNYLAAACYVAGSMLGPVNPSQTLSFSLELGRDAACRHRASVPRESGHLH